MISLASDYGRYGYRRITAMLRREGFMVNHKRVERLWKIEGLYLRSSHQDVDYGSMMALVLD